MSQGGGAWAQRVAELAQESDRAYLVALRAAGSPALAEEAVQEAYLKILRDPPQDLGYERVLAYHIKTVRHTAINLAKNSRARKRREEAHVAATPDSPCAPDELSAKAETTSAVRSALASLPGELREAVSCCFELGLSRRAASELLEVPEQTLAHRVDRGLDRLRSLLTTQGFASLTPLALGAWLLDQGIPPAPSGVLKAMGELAKGAAHAGLRAGTPAAAKAGAGVGVGAKVVLGVVLTAGVAGVLGYATRNQSSPTEPLKSTLPPPPPAQAPQPSAAQKTPGSGGVFPKSIADSLVGYWSFDEASGGVSRDLSGHGHDASVFGKAVCVEGKRGKALLLDGKTARVDIPSLSGAAFPAAGTLAFWMNNEFNLTRAGASIFDYWGHRNHILLVTEPENQRVALTFARKSERPLGSGAIFTWTKKLNAHEWYHLAVVWDTPHEWGRVYLNGAQVESGSIDGGPWTPDGQVFQLGDPANSLTFFKGLIDEVVLCNKPLSSDEVQVLHRRH